MLQKSPTLWHYNMLSFTAALFHNHGSPETHVAQRLQIGHSYRSKAHVSCPLWMPIVPPIMKSRLRCPWMCCLSCLSSHAFLIHLFLGLEPFCLFISRLSWVLSWCQAPPQHWRARIDWSRDKLVLSEADSGQIGTIDTKSLVISGSNPHTQFSVARTEHHQLHGWLRRVCILYSVLDGRQQVQGLMAGNCWGLSEESPHERRSKGKIMRR